MKKNFIYLALLILTSCVAPGKIIEGDVLSGVRAKFERSEDSIIIYGKVSVYDQSRTFANYNDEITNSCTFFVNNNPPYKNTYIYKYNRPEIGQASNIANNVFAIEIKEEMLKDDLLFSIGCGNRVYLESKVKILPEIVNMSYSYYVKFDLKETLKDIPNKKGVFYIGDIKAVLPKNTNIIKRKPGFLTRLFAPSFSGHLIYNIVDNPIITVDSNFGKTTQRLNNKLSFIDLNVAEKSIIK